MVAFVSISSLVAQIASRECVQVIDLPSDVTYFV